MKKHLLASAALLVLGTAMPAAADVFVVGFVDYDKFVSVNETLTKNKDVSITVTIDFNGSTAAESNAVQNQRIGGVGGETGGNISLYVSGQDGANRNNGVDYLAQIGDSVNRNIGAVQFNQDVGVGSNQANLISAAVGSFASFVEANNSASQFNNANIVIDVGREPELGATLPNLRAAEMRLSVNDNIGVVQVNQNAGVFNNQLNSVSVALGLNPGAVALAESDLGQFNTNQTTVEVNVARRASMNFSGNFNTGITMGNQAAGYMANQANLVSIGASFDGGSSAASATGSFLGSLPPRNF